MDGGLRNITLLFTQKGPDSENSLILSKVMEYINNSTCKQFDIFNPDKLKISYYSANQCNSFVAQIYIVY